jgi:glycogen synthase
MRIAVLTNEYPPYSYGGAGVHVEYLTRELSRLHNGANRIEVLSFGDQEVDEPNLRVEGVSSSCRLPAADPRHRKVLSALVNNLLMAGKLDGVDLVHAHTWYTHFAGCLLRELLEVPLVLTTHSLEPHRPWKAEQLGSGYRVSTWLERTAYRASDAIVAVSRSMKEDVAALYGVNRDKVRVIHNGIDIEEYQPTWDASVLRELGIDLDRPYILFVGRITRQKGIVHLVRAIEHIQPGTQIVLCAASPDTEELRLEMETGVQRARSRGAHRVVWIDHPVPKAKLIPLYTQAAVFVCPSIYEPFGIINLEAMACSTPVVASAVGGIPEIVQPGETGLLVPIDPVSPESAEPADPDRFARDLADAVNRLLTDPALRRRMAESGLQRVRERFSWRSIAKQTFELYRSLISG